MPRKRIIPLCNILGESGVAWGTRACVSVDAVNTCGIVEARIGGAVVGHVVAREARVAGWTSAVESVHQVVAGAQILTGVRGAFVYVCGAVGARITRLTRALVAAQQICTVAIVTDADRAIVDLRAAIGVRVAVETDTREVGWSIEAGTVLTSVYRAMIDRYVAVLAW